MSDYDAAFASATQGLSPAAPPQNEYDAIMSGLIPKAPAEVATPKPKKGSGSELIDAGNAVGTGYFKGLASLAGLPVDTVTSVLDLGKAAIGAPYTAVTGKAAPDWLMPADRKNIVGTGAYILDKAGNTDAALPIAMYGIPMSALPRSNLGRILTQAVNPEFEGGYLQAGGGALTGVMRPQTVAQGVNQAINSVAGVTAGKAVGDATGNQALAIAAGMSPTLAQNLAVSGLKLAVRGGEAGRREMEQRIQDLKNAGVENPTLGLASGNSLIGGAENLLQSTPGAVKVMRNARDNAVNGLQAKANAAADLASLNRGSLESGVAIQEGIKSFKDTFKDKQTQLYGNLDKFIPGSTPVNVAGTKGTLAALNSDIPGAPELSKQFKNARIMGIEDAIIKDTAGNAPGVVTTTRGAGGLMNQPETVVTGRLPGGSSTDLLPFEAVKKTRTLVGNEIADNSLVSTVPRSKWNALYGALSGDMGAAANQAGPQAAGAFNRANDFTKAGLQRLDRVAPFANRDAPEQSFRLLNQTLGDNVSTLQAVKKSLPEGARGTVAGTVIEKLGTARAGSQNDVGSVWSPDTFLTNWNKMKPEARQELFSGFPNAKQVMSDVSAVAKATSMMRDSSKLWSNPSGTAANLAARGTIGAIAGGGAMAAGGLLNPVVPVAAAGGLLGAYGAARAVTSPMMVNSAAQRTYIDPQILNAQVNALVGGGLLDQR